MSCPSRCPPQQCKKTFKIVMARHGESEWNGKNLFCGWYNAELSERGVSEAHKAGKALKDAGYKFDLAYSSVLKRANVTCDIILKELGQTDLSYAKTWRLNERHYGGLTGLNKAETVEKFGEAQVAIWRRSFDTPPPPITPENPYYDIIINDPIYADGPPKDQFPLFESLKLTMERTLPYWHETIVPRIKEDKSILIAAHGNSLRAIVFHLKHMTPDEIMKVNLPTGIPFVFTLDEDMKVVGDWEFLGDPETVRKAIEEVVNQGKAKKK